MSCGLNKAGVYSRCVTVGGSGQTQLLYGTYRVGRPPSARTAVTAAAAAAPSSKPSERDKEGEPGRRLSQSKES